jgi:sulfur carrier protein
MTITLNGKSHELTAPCSVAGLLESLGLAGRPVVVELDEAALLPREYPERQVVAGARLEIITIAAGG